MSVFALIKQLSVCILSLKVLFCVQTRTGLVRYLISYKVVDWNLIIFQMSGDDGTVPPSAEDSDVGPGQLYAPFLAMECLLDKLKLLNYDKDFILELKMKPLNR